MKRIVYLLCFIVMSSLVPVMAGCSPSDPVGSSSEKTVSEVTLPEITLMETVEESVSTEERGSSVIETEETESEAVDHSINHDTETESLEGSARSETIQVVPGTSGVRDLARQKGLSSMLEEKGCEPIFRLDSTEDIERLCQIFAEDHGYGTDVTYLAEGMAAYDEDFFTDHELYVIYCFFYTGGYNEEDFTVNSLLRNQVLHFQIQVSYSNRYRNAATAGYWIYIPMERSRTKDLIAYDASVSTLIYHELPPDWTEPVNPDWR